MSVEMNLLVLRSVWSGSHCLKELVEQSLLGGFDGIEGVIPKDEAQQHKLRQFGYAQHAQVTDPRAPEYTEALVAHERWWNLIWLAQVQRQMTQVTCWLERQRQRFSEQVRGISINL